MRDHDEVSFDATFVAQTDRAMLFDFADIGKEWIPKSQIRHGPDDNEVVVGSVYEIWLPSWLAEEKGLE